LALKSGQMSAAGSEVGVEALLREGGSRVRKGEKEGVDGVFVPNERGEMGGSGHITTDEGGGVQRCKTRGT
jgi:hypothetical protein